MLNFKKLFESKTFRVRIKYSHAYVIDKRTWWGTWKYYDGNFYSRQEVNNYIQTNLKGKTVIFNLS